MIITKQTSLFNKFSHTIYHNDNIIGALEFPMFFNATNARLKFENHKNINFTINNEKYDIVFTILERGFNNKIKHELINKNKEIIATISQKDNIITYTSQNNELTLKRTGGVFKSYIEIYSNNQKIGTVEDLHKISINREICSTIETLPQENQIFLIYFFIVTCLN